MQEIGRQRILKLAQLVISHIETIELLPVFYKHDKETCLLLSQIKDILCNLKGQYGNHAGTCQTLPE